MSLTDQEQVILKAIDQVKRGDVALIADVVKAVGYPKATSKKILIGLSNKGVVSLHRHDYPSSLTPAQRKLMVRIKGDYFNAVSMRKRNPKSGKGKSALRKTGRALKSAARGLLASGSEILGAGASVLNPVRRKVRNKYVDLVIKGQAKKTKDGWKVGSKTFAQGRGTVNVSSGYYLDRHTGTVYAKRERNVARKSPLKAGTSAWVIEQARKAKRRGLSEASALQAIKDFFFGDQSAVDFARPFVEMVYRPKRKNVEQGFYDASGFHPIRASSDYSEGQRPSRSKRAKSVKRKAKATASHKRTVSSRKKTTKRLASRAIKKTAKTRRRRNVQQGFYDSSGFHPIRSSSDYDPGIAGETGRASRKTRSKKRVAAKRKAASTVRARARVRTRKATTSRLAGRAIKRSAGLLKKRKNPTPQVLALVNRTKSKAAQNRKEFAGEYRRDTPLRYPEGTPTGVSKLGRLLKIKTDRATIEPINNQTWLVRDLKGKLHIGTTSKDGSIWSGPSEDFGRVRRIEYEDVKKHLGYDQPQGFYHFMGEENGNRPTLYADGKGGLKFRGGDYRITPEGIVN